MTLDERLIEIFDRGNRGGINSQSREDQELYLIQDFIVEFEMNGLSGYFYNRLPNIESIWATALSMQKNGLLELSSLLFEAARLFREYADPDPLTTWAEVLQQFAPNHQLHELSPRIQSLGGY